MKAESLSSFEKIDRNAERLDTPYDQWATSQGVDVFKGYFIEDIMALPLKWWERKGGNGTFINLEGGGYQDDAFVCSIPPGKSLNPERHLFEELVYVLEGRGATPSGRKTAPNRASSGRRGVSSPSL